MNRLKMKGFITLLAGLFILQTQQLYARQNSQIWVTEIQVARPDNGTTSIFYNPEIHLYEADTDSFLACSGNLNNLDCAAMAYDYYYSVKSAFQINDSTALNLGEIVSKNIYLRVIANNDNAPCPGPAVIPPDRLLATSPPFAGSSLVTNTVMQLGKVTLLRLGAQIVRTPPPSSPLVKVKEIQVINESDGIGRLEVEVHLYDQATGVFLGCSGQINGLEEVDNSGTFYNVDARFRRPLFGPDLTFQDIQDRDVYMTVIEDDSRPCPCADNSSIGDDLIARTNAFPGKELTSKLITNLQKLKHLFVAVDGIPNRVTLLTPPDFSQVTASNPVFTWQTADMNIEQYQFQLASDSMMANLVVDEITAATNLTVDGNLLEQNFYWWRVRAKNALGWGLYSRRNVFFYSGMPTAVDEPIAVPTMYFLEQNYPNPFNPSTVISFQLPEISQVRLMVYNLSGQHVRTLVDAQKPAGRHQVIWDGRNDSGDRLASGVYVYIIFAGDFRATLRMTLLK